LVACYFLLHNFHMMFLFCTS